MTNTKYFQHTIYHDISQYKSYVIFDTIAANISSVYSSFVGLVNGAFWAIIDVKWVRFFYVEFFYNRYICKQPRLVYKPTHKRKRYAVF